MIQDDDRELGGEGNDGAASTLQPSTDEASVDVDSSGTIEVGACGFYCRAFLRCDL